MKVSRGKERSGYRHPPELRLGACTAQGITLQQLGDLHQARATRKAGRQGRARGPWIIYRRNQN